MVGARQIVIDRFGNSDDLYGNCVFFEIAIEFHDGVHGIVTADIEERADIMGKQVLRDRLIYLG